MKKLKPAIYAVILLVAGGAWLYLYKMNEAEKKAIYAIGQSIKQTQAEEAAKQAARVAELRKKILVELSSCQDEANKSMNDFIAANQKPDRRKRGHFVVTEDVADKAVKMFTDSNMLCQQAYTDRSKMVF